MGGLTEYGYELTDLSEVIVYFLTDYYWAGKNGFVCAPTNYVLSRYDGIYFEGGDIGSLGSVYYDWWQEDDMSPPRHYRKAFSSCPALSDILVFGGKILYTVDE